MKKIIIMALCVLSAALPSLSEAASENGRSLGEAVSEDGQGMTSQVALDNDVKVTIQGDGLEHSIPFNDRWDSYLSAPNMHLLQGHSQGALSGVHAQLFLAKDRRYMALRHYVDSGRNGNVREALEQECMIAIFQRVSAHKKVKISHVKNRLEKSKELVKSLMSANLFMGIGFSVGLTLFNTLACK
jgi:hypothetical protein